MPGLQMGIGLWLRLTSGESSPIPISEPDLPRTWRKGAVHKGEPGGGAGCVSGRGGGIGLRSPLRKGGRWKSLAGGISSARSTRL